MLNGFNYLIKVWLKAGYCKTHDQTSPSIKIITLKLKADQVRMSEITEIVQRKWSK